VHCCRQIVKESLERARTTPRTTTPSELLLTGMQTSEMQGYGMCRIESASIQCARSDEEEAPTACQSCSVITECCWLGNQQFCTKTCTSEVNDLSRGCSNELKPHLRIVGACPSRCVMRRAYIHACLRCINMLARHASTCLLEMHQPDCCSTQQMW
jgi:hypothetical protein